MKVNRNYLNKGLLAFLFLLLIYLLLGISNLREELFYKNTAVDALQSQMKVRIDQYGREVAEKKSLVLSLKDLKKIHAGDSSQIASLQKEVTRLTRAVTLFTSVTSGTIAAPSPSIVFMPGDSIYPTYIGKAQDVWSTITFTVGKSEPKFGYNFINKYVFKETLSEKQGKWPFKYRVPVVQVVSENPNTNTTGITSWQTTPPNPKKSFVKGGITGAIATAALFIILGIR